MNYVFTYFLFFSLSAISLHAQTLGRRNMPQMLKQISDLIMPFVPILDYKTKSKLVEEEKLSDSQTKRFPWEEYERLSEAFEQGTYLNSQELNRFFQLQAIILNNNLEPPTAVTHKPIATSCSSRQVPGMRMAGCGQSTGNAQAPPTAAPKPASSSADDSLLAEAIERANTTGVLNLSIITLTPDWIQKIPHSLLKQIHTLDLSRCNLRGKLSDLSQLFPNLKELDVSNNQLNTLGALPKSLEKLEINNNYFVSEPNLSGLTNLCLVDARFNRFTEFPSNIYLLLTNNYKNSHSEAKLELIGNYITQSPTLSTIPVTLDNHPALISSRSFLRDSITFSSLYPDEILTNQLYLGDIEHLNEETLMRLGISVIISCDNDRRITGALKLLYDSKKFKIYNISLNYADKQFIDLSDISTIINSFKTLNQRVLISCRQGISHSATVTIAYLMLFEGFSLINAIKLLKEKRPKIEPNPGFMRQLVTLAKAEDENRLIKHIDTIFNLKTD